MGNATSSVEATQPPRETSRKLSKPRAGRHAFSTAGLLSSKSGSDSGISQRPNTRGSGGGLPTRPSISSHASLSSPPVNGLVSRNCEPVPSDFDTCRSSDPNPVSHKYACLDPTSPKFITKGKLMWMRAISSDTFAARDLEANPPQPHSHLQQSANMHKYEYFVPESRYGSGSTLGPSHPNSQPTSPQLSRTNSDVSLYAPIRRRSLIQTPGIATRAPSVSELTKRSSTKLAPGARHSRTTSFDPGPENISVLPRISDCGEERAVTPNDIDYRQLGAMRFGSLRITNGAPSPSSDKKGGADGPTQKPFQLNDGSDSSMDAEPKGRTAVPKIVQPKPISANISPVTAAFLKLESGDFDQSSVVSKHNDESLRALLPRLNSRSFSLTGSESKATKLQATSKRAAAEDNLIEEDVSSRHLEYDGVASHDTTSTRRQAGLGRSNTTVKARSIARPDSGFISSPTSETSSHKPFSKTDSGYSSNVSLRSLRSSKISTDKELPSRPDEPSRPSVLNRSSSTASFLGDSRPPPQPVSLGRESAPAPLDQEVRPPPPPPKDDRHVARTAPSSVTKSASMPLLNRSATSAKAKGTAHRPSFLSTSGNRVSGPESPSSVQLSPELLNASGSVTTHPAAVQKPGPIKRLFGAASMKRSRSNLDIRSFLNSGTSSTSRDSTTLMPFRIKSSRDVRRGAGAGLSAMESANAEEPFDTTPPQTVPSQSKLSTGATVRRHRSLQSIPATIFNAAVSVLPSRRSIRRSVSCTVEESHNDEDQNEEVEGNERWSGTSSAESDVASTEEYTRDSLMRNGFDPSFMAMTSARDAYFSPAPSRAPSRASSRAPPKTGFVASWPVDVRTAEVQALSRTGSLASFDTRSSQTTSIPEHPHMSTSHPLMRTRSVAQLRVPAPLRPHSTPSRLHRSQSQTLYSRPSREFIYSYPVTTASSQSSFDSTRSPLELQNRYQQRSANSGDRGDLALLNGPEEFHIPTRGTGSYHSRTNSVSSQGSSIGLYVRSTSANPYLEQQNHIPRRLSSASPFPDIPRQGPALRHRASYEVQSSKLMTRPRREFRRQSPNLWTSTHYEQLQMQYGGTAFDPRAGGYPPHVPRSGHSRNRSVVTQGPGAPYRVLHSYYSPAYRHVPIWG